MYEMTRIALRMGLTAFGGPAAHIAILRHEVIERRGWLSEEEFLDFLSASNIIPGPNSTELVMHLGGRQGGRRGLIAAGAAFILPAALITLAFAVAYKEYGATPEGRGFLAGIGPALLIVMAVAIGPLTRAAVHTVRGSLLLIGLVTLYLLGAPELVVLASGALLYAVPSISRPVSLLALASVPAQVMAQGSSSVPDATVRAGAIDLFVAFLRIGAVLYGSGYVLIAFMRSELVEKRHWLTEQQLLDAVAVGQVTPGPVFSASTFVGYITNGFAGAATATLGIFLPAFVFVLATHRWVARIRQSPTLSVLLDGLNLASTALLIGVLIRLGRALDVTSLTPAVLMVAVGGLLTGRLGPTAVLLISGALGLVWQLA
jgi:chromate transporter